MTRDTDQNTHFLGTPFHGATSGYVTSCSWYGWGDFVIPDVYTSMRDELQAVRNTAALIDMSPLPKMTFSGPDSDAVLDKLMTRPVQQLGVGRCLYTPWCNDDGQLIGDGLIFRLSEEEFIVAGENSQCWFESHATGHAVEITDQTGDYGILALQGPRSADTLAALLGSAWHEIGFSELAFHQIAGVDVIIARQGFTGERGYEIWIPQQGGCEVWHAVMAAGREFGAKPAGEYAIDVARVEAGLILVSADYTGAGPDEKTANVAVDDSLVITPFEAGLGRLVDLTGNRDYVGSQALMSSSGTDKEKRRFLGLRLEPGDVLNDLYQAECPTDALSRVHWGSTKVYQGDVIGRASSLCWSPTLGCAISFAFLDANAVEPGDKVEVELPNPDGTPIGKTAATVVDTPFVQHRRSL